MSAQSLFLFYASSLIGGRGVFSIKDLKEGEIIESCPVIILPKEQISLLDQTVLYDYYFLFFTHDLSFDFYIGSRVVFMYNITII